MKTIVETLRQHNIICKKFTSVSPKELGSRKRIDLYVGVDVSGYYCSAMILVKKSRVLRKEVGELMALHKKLESYADTSIKKTYIAIDAPLCSKARSMLEEAGWLVIQPSPAT